MLFLSSISVRNFTHLVYMHSVVTTKPTVRKNIYTWPPSYIHDMLPNESFMFLQYLIQQILTDMIYVKWLFWSEVTLRWSSWGQSTVYIRLTLYWGYLIVLWLFIWCVSCTMAVLNCLVMCGCFENCVGVLVICLLVYTKCTCIYFVLCCLYCDFVLFRLCTNYSFLFLLSLLV